MIKPTEELVKWMETFVPQSKLADILQIDEAYLSRIKSGKQNVSSSMMELFKQINGWPLSRAWEITDE